jgi:ParB-like chromosome segregation protein Spo0J
MSDQNGDNPYQLMDPLRDEERAALRADIAKRGVLIPVEKDDQGNTLDGHHREEFAAELGIPCPTVTRTFATEQEKREHVIGINMIRRQMEPWQWGLAFKRLLKERGVERKAGAPPKGDNSPTIGELCRDQGVSESTAYDRLKAADEFERLTEKTQQAIRNRETTLAKVKAKQRKDKTKRAEAAARRRAGEVNEWVVTTDQDVVTCDALVTDPPYGILDEDWEPDQLEEFTRDWLVRWSQCGADLAAVFWSQRYLWEGRRWFDESLMGYAFQQLLVWHYANNKSPQSRRGFKQTWEPIFLYRRNQVDREIRIGAASEKWGGDLTDFDCHCAAVPQTNFNGENMKQHPAQKPVSVMRWLVNALSEPGELVADPFCGSGTTGIAAIQLGRRFHGVEVNEDYRTAAQGRIAAYGKRGV